MNEWWLCAPTPPWLSAPHAGSNVMRSFPLSNFTEVTIWCHSMCFRIIGFWEWNPEAVEQTVELSVT